MFIICDILDFLVTSLIIMSINGNIKKYGAIALIFGGIISASLFVVVLNLGDDIVGPGDNDPSQFSGIGARIAARMAETEDNISYVWMYNNSFVNGNLSEHYEQPIDGVRIGLVNNEQKIALIHEPAAEVVDINQSDLNSVMSNFRGAIEVLNDTNQTMTDIMDIWPPSFICDIAYEDNTSLSLIFSKEKGVLSVVNGTWSLSSFTHHGINALDIQYSFDNLVFLPITNIQLMIEAIQSLENFIYNLFPI